jgi:hypothetical protein
MKTTRLHRSFARVLAFGAACAMGLSAAPAEAAPCGGVTFRAGEIGLGDPLTPALPLSADDDACIDHLAEQIGERANMRGVTIAVRMDDAARASGIAIDVGRAIMDELVDSGASRAKLSVVAPALADGQDASIRIAYSERKSSRAVALIYGVTGIVKAGRYSSSLKAADPNDSFPAHTWFTTGEDSAARIYLADGSFIRLAADTTLQVGAIDLNEKLERTVSVEVATGRIDVIAAHAGSDAVFDIITRTAVAGVRGTEFRVTADSAGTRVETTDGTVELAGSQAAVMLPRAMGSQVDALGTPEPPRSLLSAPTEMKPSRGTAESTSSLSWARVAGAVSYVVEVARDAQMSRELDTAAVGATSQPIGSNRAAGRWYWRVMAVDADGFIGMPSKIYAFEIAADDSQP